MSFGEDVVRAIAGPYLLLLFESMPIWLATVVFFYTYMVVSLFLILVLMTSLRALTELIAVAISGKESRSLRFSQAQINTKAFMMAVFKNFVFPFAVVLPRSLFRVFVTLLYCFLSWVGFFKFYANWLKDVGNELDAGLRERLKRALWPNYAISFEMKVRNFVRGMFGKPSLPHRGKIETTKTNLIKSLMLRYLDNTDGQGDFPACIEFLLKNGVEKDDEESHFIWRSTSGELQKNTKKTMQNLFSERKKEWSKR